eukprot:g4555.t1
MLRPEQKKSSEIEEQNCSRNGAFSWKAGVIVGVILAGVAFLVVKGRKRKPRDPRRAAADAAERRHYESLNPKSSGAAASSSG